MGKKPIRLYLTNYLSRFRLHRFHRNNNSRFDLDLFPCEQNRAVCGLRQVHSLGQRFNITGIAWLVLGTGGIAPNIAFTPDTLITYCPGSTGIVRHERIKIAICIRDYGICRTLVGTTLIDIKSYPLDGESSGIHYMAFDQHYILRIKNRHLGEVNATRDQL